MNSQPNIEEFDPDLLVPASSTQSAIWLSEAIEPDTPAYNLPRALHIHGDLDVDLLGDCFAALIARHDALRMSFLEHDGKIWQRAHKDSTIAVPLADLTGLPEDSRLDEALRLAKEEGRKPFDLSSAPLVRALVVRLAPQEHLLVLVTHHLVTDGWSLSLIFDELAETYQAGLAGKQAELAELPVSYADFARWHADHTAEAALAPHLAYWAKALEGCPETLDLPFDHSHPATASHKGSVHSFKLSLDLTAALNALCASERSTSYMGLLTVLQILLSRYSGQEDIVIGVPVAGRDDPDLANVVGCFVNTLVMRSDLSGNPSFRQALARVRATALEVFSHQDAPFEKVLEHIRPQRTDSHAPLFQVMMILQNMPKQAPRLPALELEELDLDPGTAKFDLTLELVERDDGLSCFLEYRTDLFDEATILRMERHLRNLVQDIVRRPDAPISQLELMDAEERATMLDAWNRTEAPYPRDERIEDVFARTAKANGEAAAIIEGERTTTFAELDLRSDRIAQAIRSRAGAETALVGVHLSRSAEAVAAILGAMKAGYPYLPLDLSQPQERLHRIVGDAACDLVVTTRKHAAGLPSGVRTILLDEEAETQPPAAAPARGSQAYVIYTSGSTGDPKGVIGTHRATLNRLEWMYRAYPFVAGEVCCQKTALGFVDSIWEMFGPLLAGVPSVVVEDADLLDPRALLTRLGSQGVTRIVLVPSLLQVILDHVPDFTALAPSLRLWTVSGEYLSSELARRFHAAAPGARLLNLYGSSEVAADVTAYEVPPTTGTEPVPIGKPIANCRVYILDREGRPAPVGVAGQIHAAGDCLSEGYWRRPDLTGERFVKGRLAEEPATMFATGDMGRFRGDGQIEYLGRIDHQVKIRGNRVELGEVEAQIMAHPDVRQAVVVATGSALDQQRQLVAYVVGRDGPAPSPEALRAFLRARLPLYMAPSSVVALDELPLLPSGKIDRRRLPPPRDLSTEAPTRVAPRTETETFLASEWCELLHLDEVGVTQDFFDLGGHSLLAMQVLARIRKRFEVDVSIRTLFDAPRIDRLAEEIDGLLRSGAKSARAAITPRAAQPPQLDNLAAQLGKLSPEQLEQLLAQIRQPG